MYSSFLVNKILQWIFQRLILFERSISVAFFSKSPLKNIAFFYHFFLSTSSISLLIFQQHKFPFYSPLKQLEHVFQIKDIMERTANLSHLPFQFFNSTSVSL